MLLLYLRPAQAWTGREEKTQESPESLIMPYEDINTSQQRISGETFPDIILELCDNCNWSCTCLNMRGIVDSCPLCKIDVSHIPMTLEEACNIKYDDRRGMILEFSRQNPLR
ncbi:hypothetical protein NVIE_015680 [Nitrososphaera viennensis EN76]|uniref:Uncharacterized protein n=1 Tax=Nitrososphaera viennensis EN76 TaxID=926571 RepID=A0A060HRI6_9ARCH|nr:hypothetical protein NVIE_015680 [Nitrososphaera viennensis EN76]